MSLHEENKAERKRRIIAAARRLIARDGYDGLNMRALADAARVWSPRSTTSSAASTPSSPPRCRRPSRASPPPSISKKRGDAVERAGTLLQAGIKNLVAVPGYYRELVQIMLTSREPDELRRSIEDQYCALMAGNLRAGQADGELADWFDADVLARQMFFTFMMVVLGWARGEIDDVGLEQVAIYGQSMLLLGVARGQTAARLVERVRRLQARINRR